MTQPTTVFEEDPPRQMPDTHDADALLLNLDGYEGPIEVLLDLARNQKVDLSKISMLQLARQYLQFIERAKQLDLQLAAEYLVMAAWLAYLKSRLLLPQEKTEDEPSAEEMAEALQFQLRRLEAMQNASEQLFARPQLGQQIHRRGATEGLATVTKTKWKADLYDMIRAYGNIHNRKNHQTFDLPKFTLMSMDDALKRLTRMLGQLPKKAGFSAWTTLKSFLPEGIRTPLYARSSMASLLTASLEMAKQGQVEIKQDGLFRPIYMRAHAQTDTPEYKEEAA